MLLTVSTDRAGQANSEKNGQPKFHGELQGKKAQNIIIIVGGKN